MNILLNEESKQQIDQFIKRPGHALGIFAPSGSGKFFAAHYIAASVLGDEGTKNNPNLYIVRPGPKGSITIDQAREITHFLKLKHGAKNGIARIVIVDDASALTTEAQNALLKTLEEPPRDALIILTANGESSLLPTIISRLKVLNLKPVSKIAVVDFFVKLYNTKDIERAYVIANGRLGLMTALLTNVDHDLITAIESAKSFLSLSQYERLATLDQILKQDVYQFLEALQLVSDSAFKQSSKKGVTSQTKRWHVIRKNTAETMEGLNANAHAKLTMTNLILNI